MRWFLALLMAMLCSLCSAQTTTTSSFQPTWVDVPKPDPISMAYRMGGDASETGTYEYAMSWVDEAGRVSEKSDSVTLSPTLRNWGINARLPNYPVWTRAVGWVLWCRRTGGSSPAGPGGATEYDWRPAGAQGGAQNTLAVTRPILPMCGWESHLLRGHGVHRAVRWFANQLWPAYEDNQFWPKSTVLSKPALPPIVSLIGFPNRKHKVAISWACNQGESPLSDELVVEQFDISKWGHQEGAANSEFHCGDMIWRGDSRIPQGALGIYVYVQWDGETQWHRQKTPAGDGYLWPFINRLPLGTFTESGIGPASPPGRSLLSPLQVAIEAGSGNIIVDGNQTIYCPVINPLSNAYGTCVGRTITAPHGVRWKIGTSLPGGETDWPMWVECSQETRLVNCQMESASASVGIEFVCYTDSCGFSFNANGLKINLYRPGYNSCIRQLWEARSPNFHTESEPKFSSISLGGIHPVVCEGSQSANWLFKDAAVICTGGIESALITCGNNGTMQFTDRMVMTGSKELTYFKAQALIAGVPYNVWSDPDAFVGGRSMWASISTVQGEAERVFIDQGFPCWFTVSSLSTPTITVGFTKVNQWADWLHVAESSNGPVQGQTRLKINGEFSQHNNPVVSIHYAGKALGVEVMKSERMTLLQGLMNAQGWPVVLP